MKSILEQMFMGEINVTESLAKEERKPIPGSNSFIKALTPEQQQKYEEIFDDLMIQWTLDNQECFVLGFKMAARMLLEVLADN